MYVRLTYIAQTNEIPWFCPEFHVCHIAPIYLTEMVFSEVPHIRNLRSTQRRLLYTPKSRTEFVHSSSFKSMGPHIWNTLPANVKNSYNIGVFKYRLYLFSVSYQ